MWHEEFADRLKSWSALRTQVQDLPIEQALDQINAWWQQSPWQSYYLHWDDINQWPDPWQLLEYNVYCEVARALGIVYTIVMLDRSDMLDSTMVLTGDGYNLVLVNKKKYALNWGHEILVNSNLVVNIKRQITQEQFKQYR